MITTMKKIILTLALVTVSVLTFAQVKQVSRNQLYQLNHSKMSYAPHYDYSNQLEPTAQGKSLVSSAISIDKDGSMPVVGHASTLSAIGSTNVEFVSGAGMGAFATARPVSLVEDNGVFTLGLHGKHALVGGEISGENYLGSSEPFEPTSDEGPAPLGDALIPMLLMILAFGGWKFWKK